MDCMLKVGALPVGKGSSDGGSKAQREDRWGIWSGEVMAFSEALKVRGL